MRFQRLQGLRIVPVEEVPSVAFHDFHRAECIGGAFDQFSGRNVAEVECGQIRQ